MHDPRAQTRGGMGKIAFWRTLRAAFYFTLGDLSRFFRLSGLWLVAILGFQVLQALPVSPIVRALASVGLGLFAFGGFTAFPVAWHRTILVGENRGMIAALRFGRREWRFLGYALLVSAMIFSPLLLLLGVTGEIVATMRPRLGIAVAAIPFGSALAGWCLVSRLTLVLPAIAVDETGAVLRRAWSRARGNGARLFLGWLICTVPFVAMSGGLRWLQTAIGSTVLMNALLGALPFVVQFFEVAVTVGFLSHSYQQLASFRPEPLSDEAVPELS